MSNDGIDVRVPPSGTGCAECDAHEPPGWWFHLRRCAECGHIGCCDSSPAQHATGHRYIQSFEPGEDWFFDYETGQLLSGPELAPPTARPEDQPTPGPAGRVPQDWRSHIH